MSSWSASMGDALRTRVAERREQHLPADEERRLRERLGAAWAQVGATGVPPVDALVAAWLEPWRHYHGVSHLKALLRGIDGLDLPPADRALLELAAWFHDAVLIPLRTDNEERSAVWARDALRAAGRPDAGARLYALIAATRHHQADGDALCAVFLDLDLGVLGASPAAYAAYVDGVRREFARLPARSWRQGRRRVLEHLLAGGIYQTPTFQAEREEAARRNLAAELARL